MVNRHLDQTHHHFHEIVVAGYQTGILQRQIDRIAIQRALSSGDEPEKELVFIKRQVKLLRLNFVLSLVVLSLTAVARTT